ncbi:MAG TPA: M1 family aminopeptidase, partial [Longimicrobium sp.]|nr:M1 family aminopeptidase [Longimicrobium sp.]
PFVNRLRAAAGSDTVVHVLTPADFEQPMPARTDVPTWRFRARDVRDVAFTVARRITWDATRTAVGDRDGDGTMDYTAIHAIWRPNAPRWRNAAAYAAHSIRFLSQYTGVPYPWPHMTSVEGEGIIGGGMEYPMMTLIGAYNTRGDSALYYVVAHELAHMWVPMIAGVDERRFGWMDEGMTTFHEAQARKDYFPGSTPELEDRAGYLDFARASEEGEIMRRSDFHYSGGAYGTASYPKPAVAFAALRGVLGQARFDRAWRRFLHDWAFKKPQPWDLFNTVETVAGEDLDWFWRTWFYETWTLDQAVRGVTVDRGVATIVIEDIGNAPMPARVTVTRAGGGTETLEVPVQIWLRGARTTTITLPTTTSTAPIVRVEIDAANEFPDIDRTNNVWPRP